MTLKKDGTPRKPGNMPKFIHKSRLPPALKSEKEIIAKCNEIIDGLKDFQIVDKWKVIDNLHGSLIDTARQSGIILKSEAPKTKVSYVE